MTMFEFVLLTALTVSVLAQEIPDNDEYQYGQAIKCKRDDGVSQRCIPVFENIAFDKVFYANNTCGLNGPSEYCVQTGTSGAKKICEICDNSRPDQRHPAEMMTDMNLDETPTWWQSETLLEQKYGVHLILDFKKKYNVAFIRIRFHTIRPHSFSIYKKSSYDPNEKWLPYQFYSRKCEERYNLPNNQVISISNQKIALCTDKYSGMIPLSGGNVAYLTLANRPGKRDFDNYPELQDWVTVTALRFNLDRLNTFGDEVFGDPKVLKSYYYAISDIAVGSRCKCNGHASICERDNNGDYFCRCDHNTAGKDCEKCLPLYNDRPWRRAVGHSANPCKKCDCNDLADECVFDEQLYLDSDSVSGGRCKNCEKNTAGVHCERCKEHHYRETEEDACKPCYCNIVGSISLSCSRKGQCACKAGVTGVKCDQCKPGYYGFSPSGCRRCNCNPDGSLSTNCDITGQCKCKEHVVGRRCDQCVPYFFDLDENNPKGCKSCFCHGFGISCTALVKDGFQGVGKRVITSSFETDFDGWKLQDRFGVDYSKNLQWNIRSQFVDIKSYAKGYKELYFVAPSRYLGNRLSSYTKLLSFSYGIFNETTDPEPRTTREDIILEGGGFRASYELTDQGNPKPIDRFINYKYRLVEPPGMSVFDFQRLLSNLTAIKIRVTYLVNRPSAIDNIKMESTQPVPLDSWDQVTWKEKCECKQGHTGTQCEFCDAGYTRALGTKAPYGRCVSCECNNHATSCDPETSICECLHNTKGRNCEICKSGYYGNPTHGNPDDCKPCPCFFATECIQIGTRVKCTNCPKGSVGDSCEFCADGYYGDPSGKNGKPTQCRKCDCNGNVDPNDFGNCDKLTGDCLKCVNNTMNGPKKRCELCAVGFYGDAVDGNCSDCGCYPKGTQISPAYRPGDPIPCDNNGKCACRKNAIGRRCDQCPPGHWNVQSGRGCEKCQCNPKGSDGDDCNLVTGQCKCKPGVDGRTCDQCAAGHYKFSSTGCIACKCNLDGSKHQNCSSDGVCECLPGVLGVKCDQCPENQYNLSVGCIRCPKCFDLIKEAVTELREKLSAFNISSGDLTPGSVKIRDKNFEAAVKVLKEKILALKRSVETMMIEDENLAKLFDFLKKEFGKMASEIGALEKMLEKSEGAAKLGQTEIKKAEPIIELIKKLLEGASKKLEEEGKKIKDKDVSGGNDIGDLSKKMRKIAEEARKLADEHERDATLIKRNTEMALNLSKGAFKTAKEARDKELMTQEVLERMGMSAGEAKLLALEAENLIKQAQSSANTSLAEAEKLIEEGKKSLPDLKVNETKASALNVTKEAKKVSKKSEELVSENKDKMEKLEEDDEEARRLMKEGYGLRNDSNALYDKALNASEQAKKAQEDGLKVAREAKDMLETLLGFEIQIQRSKANATEAKKLIPLIRKLIDEANKTANEAAENARISEVDARKSLETIKEGNATAHKTKAEVDDLLERAKRLLKELMDFIMGPLATTKKDIAGAKRSLDRYEDQAGEDFEKIKKAHNDSVAASSAATMAQDELMKSLKDVEDLMRAIDALGEIDYATLEKAEKALKKVNGQLDGDITVQIDAFTRKVAKQEELISYFELDLSELRKQVAHTEALYNYMPKQCFKVAGSLEESRRAARAALR